VRPYDFRKQFLVARQKTTGFLPEIDEAFQVVDHQGEKGIAILAPIVGRRETDTAADDSKNVLGFRAAYVFDLLSRDYAT
jgi:hypothetical protein